MTDERIKSYLKDRLKRLEDLKNEERWTTAELGDMVCCKQTLEFIDSLQEAPVSEDLEKIVEEIAEPTILNAYGTKELARRLRNTICGTSVSENLEEELNKYIKGYFTIDTEQLDKFGIEEKDYMYSMDKSDMLALVEYFINWHKTKEEPVSEDLEEAAMMHYKNVMEYEAKTGLKPAYMTSFKAGAKWQKEQMIAKAIDGEVVATSDNGWESIRFYKKEHHCGQKVKVIVIKED